MCGDPPSDEHPDPAGQHVGTQPARGVVIGVLGGIASGKSAVSRLLAGPRGVVIAADAMVHAIYEEPEAAAFVRRTLGPQFLDAAGKPERAAIGRAVFSDPELRQRLEDWIHPRVRAKIHNAIDEARAAGASRIVLDVPLLLENDAQHGLAALCDTLVFVEADPDDRERRARETRGWEPGEVARREALQLPLDTKRSRAHHVLSNRGDLAALERAVRDLIARLAPER
jgi:dephospho-CoA kinase